MLNSTIRFFVYELIQVHQAVIHEILSHFLDFMYLNETLAFLNGCYLLVVTEMVLSGAAPPRGSAAAAASLRRRRTTSVGAAGGTSGNMLQLYTDDALGLKISPNVILVMSIGFIAFVAILHVMGKLYFVRREA
ncbi:hypothetical protein AAG906_009075 [Vitis piasezkii]